MPNTAPNQTQVIVLIAAFNSNHELLLLKRPDHVHCGGLWSFPGGKIEANEMPLQAAVRELKEETGLKGKRWRHLGKCSHTYQDVTLQFLFFVCFCPDISNVDGESESVWTSLSRLDHYAMPDANHKLVAMLNCDEVRTYLAEINSQFKQ